MKNHKKINVMLGVLFLILPLLTNSFGAKKVFAEETAAQVILHKKKMRLQFIVKLIINCKIDKDMNDMQKISLKTQPYM